jgi:hypothetical protein
MYLLHHNIGAVAIYPLSRPTDEDKLVCYNEILAVGLRYIRVRNLWLGVEEGKGRLSLAMFLI